MPACAGPYYCVARNILPGIAVTNLYPATASQCAEDCYYDNKCTFFMLTASTTKPQCYLMTDLFPVRTRRDDDRSTVTAGP